MGWIVYDSLTPEINESAFHSGNWSEFYGDVQEEMPPKILKVRGTLVTISAFVDANHAGNVMMSRLHTGIILYVQNALIVWNSKRQNTVEAATFGSEFVALRITKELIVAMCYKLRMFGVRIDGHPVNVFCDNRGVVKNVSIPELMLMKKHNAINYHVVREAVVAGILRFGKEDSETNLVNILTMIVGQKRWDFCSMRFFTKIAQKEKGI
jgi:hypothetical protein